MAETITPDASLTYKEVPGTPLKLHIFNPDRHQPSDRRPAIVFFFGGGWNGGTPAQFYPQCRYLAGRGMVAVSAEYRTNGSHGTTPIECVKDGKSAIRWVRARAVELGIDPDRIAAGGGSAGGHVAAATAVTTRCEEEGEDASVSCVPAALVLFNPVYDNGPGAFSHGRVKGYWRDFSPLHNLSAVSPPTIVFFGTEDKHVTPAVAEKFRDTMRSHGCRSELFLYEGQPHGFFNFKNPAYFEKTVAEADRFLASLGYLQGEPELGPFMEKYSGGTEKYTDGKDD